MKVESTTFRRILASVIFVLCVSASLRLATSAQIRPVYDQGALGLAQRLKRLNTNASALMIGAHPDDEDTALLAYLARGENARTGYLSLTRGDGGQNIVGPELGEALGVIRTEELLQARKLDGADQFFTRAYDYGFSKTLAEAKEKWDEKVILCDVVRVIRAYQPLVVISQFSGTPTDGHGQHQFAGYITPIAVTAAADSKQCTEAGVPWQVKKLYLRHRGSGEPTLRINTGKFDPLLGRSYFEIAMQARSQHRSQEQGVLELKGDQFSNLTLLEPKKAAGVPDSMFGDVDSTFAGLVAAHGLSSVISPEDVRKIDAAATAALTQYHPDNPIRIAPLLADAAEVLEKVFVKALGTGSEPSVEAVSKLRPLGHKMIQFSDAIALATGSEVVVLSDTETVVPGGTARITVNSFLARPDVVKVKEIVWRTVDGWEVTKVETPAGQTGTTNRRENPTNSAQFTLSIPKSARPTQPYWLVSQRSGSMFRWDRNPDRWMPFEGLPFGSLPVFASVTLDVGGKPLKLSKTIQYRFADDIRGEIRRDLNVVPNASIGFGESLLILPLGDRAAGREMTISVSNNSPGPISGMLRLKLPRGWASNPTEADFKIERKGESQSIRFSVVVPQTAAAGSYEISAAATVGDQTFEQTMQTVTYEHIQTHRIYRPAKAELKLIDLKTTPVRVGYIPGSGDRVMDAIKQLGLNVEEIGSNTLASGDLSKYDVIVVGIRAYQVRADIVSYNQRLTDFMTNGGTMIVQYQLPPTYSLPKLPPFPTQMGPRVSDENAPVAILQAEHPLFNFPNKISAEDFQGWVQERNLYNFSAMDPRYVGLLESHDAGEPENNGGLVVADIGKGNYVYCSYSLFRQLPAGVPGAYRLLANMLSLPKSGK